MDSSRSTLAVRMFVVYGVMMLLPCAIIVQIIRIQFFEGSNLQVLWEVQAVEHVPITAQRGKIYDRDGRLLVTNTITFSAAVDPRAPGVNRERINQAMRSLAHFTSRSSAHYNRILQQAPRTSRYVVLDRGLGREAYDSLKSLNVRGLILEENFRRRYNFNELASHVLGHVNHQLAGVMGVESSYDEYLRGVDGVQQVRKDSRSRVKEFVGAPVKMPVQGNNLYTTIDAHIQAIAEEELRDGVNRTRSAKGTVIVVNPVTGAVVALANYPSFNPNQPAQTDNEFRRNAAIADMMEPGSTFKLVTAVAAIDQNVVQLDEIFETPESGRILIHGQWMRDHDPLGNLNFAQVMQRSSNVATSEIAMRIKPNSFYQYVRNIGFGTSTGVDLPGEETGRLRKPYDWSAVSLPWMSIGYEVQVTPLQLVMAYAAFANGGRLMRPYVVDRVEDERGRIIHQNKPKIVRRAIEPRVIQTLKPIFEGVVSDSGTARFASVDGLNIVGKTGTAQKYIDGRYQTRYRASFVGFYPAEDPKYVAIVLLDEPRTSIYGGFTAGPVFRNIAQRIVGLDPDVLQNTTEPVDQHFAYAPSVKGMNLDEAAAVLQFKNFGFTVSGNGSYVFGQNPDAGEQIMPGTKITLTTNQSEIDDEEVLRVPDVTGLSMREAVIKLQQAGYAVSRNGSGTVTAQFPEAGAVMSAGRPVSVRGRMRSMEQLISSRGGLR